VTPPANWEEAAALALAHEGAFASTSYGQPAIKAANGRAFVSTGREPDTSFVLQLDLGMVDLLMETEPETYWQTPHYAGYGAVLVRFGTGDAERLAGMIRLAHEQAAARKSPRKRT